MNTYRCSWNGRTKFVEAVGLVAAKCRFQERFGFWPDEELVTITRVPLILLKGENNASDAQETGEEALPRIY